MLLLCTGIPMFVLTPLFLRSVALEPKFYSTIANFGAKSAVWHQSMKTDYFHAAPVFFPTRSLASISHDHIHRPY
jgi:hypothetical protein